MQNLKYLYTAVILTLITGLPGCTLLESHQSDPLMPDIPANWSTASESRQPVSVTWLDNFSDPALSAMVKLAIGENFDLRTVATRIDAAKATLTINSAERWPQINASLNAARSKRVSTAGAQTLSTIANNFQTGLDISWEADIWNRLGHQARAALLELNASEADFQAARLSLAANIARQWFNLIEATQQVTLTTETVSNFQQALTIIRESYQAGLNSALDVRLARTNVANAESQHAARQAQLAVQQRSLQVLLAQYPSGAITTTTVLPDAGLNIPPGLPADLLQRRPDLISAEQRLLAANERVDVAKKNRLPQIRLTSSAGASSTELKNLLDSDNVIWNIAAGLTAPVFQAGRLKASQTVAIANADQAAYQYSQVILTAFREVETALASAPFLHQQQQALENAVTEARESERLAGEQYRAGLVEIITWLEAQRQLFTARSNLLQIRNQRLQNKIDLHLALGGDFQKTMTTTNTQQP